MRHHPELTWVADRIDEMNDRLGDRHAAIGPSHFMEPDLDERWVERIWAHSVMPYLEEVFFGDPERLAEFALREQAPEDLPLPEPVLGAGDSE